MTTNQQDDFEERAAILEFCANLPRAEAERRARLQVFPRQARAKVSHTEDFDEYADFE